MEAIREIVGKETFLLGCGAPLGSVLGMVDGMRIGEDVLDHWRPVLFGIRTLFRNEPNMPAARNAILNTLTRAMMHNRWWINDPDVLIIRQNSHLTLAEIQSLASMIALSGGMLMLSDDLTKLTPDRLKIAQQLIPQMDQRPWVIDWFDQQMPGKLRLDLENETGKWHLLSISNWEDRPRDIILDVNEYQIEKGNYWARSFWDQKVFELNESGKLRMENVAPHATIVLAVRKKEISKPQFLGSDLHISQGLEISHWRTSTKKIEVELDLPRITNGNVDIYVPKPTMRIIIDGKTANNAIQHEGIIHLPIFLKKKVRLAIEY